jgi:hypothetical protein
MALSWVINTVVSVSAFAFFYSLRNPQNKFPFNLLQVRLFGLLLASGAVILCTCSTITGAALTRVLLCLSIELAWSQAIFIQVQIMFYTPTAG